MPFVRPVVPPIQSDPQTGAFPPFSRRMLKRLGQSGWCSSPWGKGGGALRCDAESTTRLLLMDLKGEMEMSAVPRHGLEPSLAVLAGASRSTHTFHAVRSPAVDRPQAKPAAFLLPWRRGWACTFRNECVSSIGIPLRLNE